jgi:RNA polymerase primary sigma factor
MVVETTLEELNLDTVDLLEMEPVSFDAEVDVPDAPLRALATHPLLSADEEVALARALAAGRRASAHLRETPDVPAADRRKLEREVLKGDEARERLVRFNLRLALSIARRYAGRGLPLEDLMQEGTLGLLRAAERYDPDLGFRFSTYATWWIRQAVRRALVEQGRSVRLPEHLVGLLGRLQRAALAIEQEHGRPATAAELAAALETTVEKVEAALKASLMPASLDAPVTEDGATLAEVVADDGPTANEVAEDRALRTAVRDALNKLTDRERLVIELRHGLDGKPPRTLAEVGEALHISRERARQLEAQALRKLRLDGRDLRTFAA